MKCKDSANEHNLQEILRCARRHISILGEKQVLGKNDINNLNGSSVEDKHIGIEVCRKEEPQQIWQKEERSHSLHPQQPYEICHSQHQQDKQHRQTQHYALHGEETEAPQHIKQQLDGK